MAINFEAANMAGYNNPKIEVFKAVMDETGLRDSPRKSVLINCMNRGGVPVIRMTTIADGTLGGYILYLSSWEGSTLIFTSAGASSVLTPVTLKYPDGSEQPEVILT